MNIFLVLFCMYRLQGLLVSFESHITFVKAQLKTALIRANVFRIFVKKKKNESGSSCITANST